MNTGIMRIYSIPDNAEVHIDGNPVRDISGNVAKAPLIMTDIPEGPHWVIFKMSGYFDEIKLIGITAGIQRDVYAMMRPIP